MAEEIFYLSFDRQATWHAVSKAEYVALERAAGFHNTLGQPDEPACDYWSNGTYSGKKAYLMKEQ